MSHKIKIYILSMGLFLLCVTQLSIFGANVLAATPTCLPNTVPACTPGATTPTGPPTELPCTPNCDLNPTPDPTSPSPSALQDIDCPSGKASADGATCVALGSGCNGKTNAQCLHDNPITKYLNDIVLYLSGLVGIVVIAVIIIGGIQYSLAGDNSTAIQDARKRIINGLIALFAFIFISAFLQWIIPGGL